MTEAIRWKQRFQNLNKAYHRLNDALRAVQQEPQNELYPIALVGAFQFIFELCWKTLKDYLKYSGVDAGLPRDVIKQAFHYQLIEDGQLWIDMLEDHNAMAHVYQAQQAKDVVQKIQHKYHSGIQQVYNLLQSKVDE